MVVYPPWFEGDEKTKSRKAEELKSQKVYSSLILSLSCLFGTLTVVYPPWSLLMSKQSSNKGLFMTHLFLKVLLVVVLILYDRDQENLKLEDV